MWSGITVIPAIEPAIRIIMNVGLLINNRYQHHCKQTNFNPDFSFTRHYSYYIPTSIFMGLKYELIGQQICLMKSFFKAGNNGETLRLRLKNSDKVYPVDIERFKIFSSTYRKLSEDFLTREGVCYSAELKEFKDITIPDSFSEENFNRWTVFLNSDIYDKDDLNQVKEFVLPECFSKETLKILYNYFHNTCSIKNLDQNSLLEFYKLVDYLEMPVLDGQCVIPFFENILKNGQTELSETELKEIENGAIIGAYTEQIKSLCAQIKECKKKYNEIEFPKELADLDLEMDKIKKEIGRNVFPLVLFGILPLFPLFLQSIAPTTWAILAAPHSPKIAHLILSTKQVLTYVFDVLKLTFMLVCIPVPFIVLPTIGNKIIPTTVAIFRKTAIAIYTIASKTLYAPIFVVKETGKAILFTVKTLGKIPSIVHSRLFVPNLAPI